MKNAHVFYSLSYGGGETFTVNISHWQVENSHQVSVLLINNTPEKELINRLDLRDRIFLVGNKSQTWIQNNLCNYDFFIQENYSEGLRLAVIEARAIKS